MSQPSALPPVDAAIEAVYRSACDRGYRLALAICGDANTSEGVVHDVFARLLGRREALRPDTLAAYVSRSVRNAAYDRVRQRGPQTLRLAVEPVAEPASSNDAPDPEVVRRALSGLPPEQREVVQLHVFEGLTFVSRCGSTQRSTPCGSTWASPTSEWGGRTGRARSCRI